MYKKIVVLILIVLLVLTGCNKEGKTKEEVTPEPVVASEKEEEEISIEDISMEVMERVYEGRSGIRFVTDVPFVATLNNATTLQMERNSTNTYTTIRADLTEYQEVDYYKLARDSKLFISTVGPKNVTMNGTKFYANKYVTMIKYTTGTPPNETYNITAVLNTKYGIIRVTTSDKVDFFEDILYTYSKVKPKATSDYKEIIAEIVRVQVGDVAVTMPMATQDSYQFGEGKLRIATEMAEGSMRIYEIEDYEEPTDAEIKEKYAKWGTPTRPDKKALDWFFNKDYTTSRVKLLPLETIAYTFEAEGNFMVPYLDTVRDAKAKDIYSHMLLEVEELEEGEDDGASGVILDSISLLDFTVLVPVGAEATTKQGAYTVEIAKDNYVKIYPVIEKANTSTARSIMPDIKQALVEGDHYIATTNDGALYYFRQIVNDNKKYNVLAIGTDGFAMAKSIKVSEEYETFAERGWERRTFNKASLWLPPGSEEAGTEDLTTFTFGTGYVVFEKKGSLTTEEKKFYTEVDKNLYYTDTGKTLGVMNIGNNYRVTYQGEEGMEAFYSITY